MIKRIINYIFNRFIPLEEQARRAGVQIGEDNFIASPFWSSEPYLIKIGSHCQITWGVKLLTHGGGQVLRDKFPDFDTFGKVAIGDYVYIGTGSLILPGVTIEDNVLVAAGSVVTKSIPKGCVVAGNPARFICTIDEYREKNEQFNLKSKKMSSLDKKDFLLKTNTGKFISKGYINTYK